MRSTVTATGDGGALENALVTAINLTYAVTVGGGGAGHAGSHSGGLGGSGVVILRYPNAYTIIFGAGVTGTTAVDGSNTVATITAGSGNVSWA
jgi:hypothetical protein